MNTDLNKDYHEERVEIIRTHHAGITETKILANSELEYYSKRKTFTKDTTPVQPLIDWLLGQKKPCNCRKKPLSEADLKKWEAWSEDVKKAILDNKSNDGSNSSSKNKEKSKSIFKCRGFITSLLDFSFPFKRNMTSVLSYLNHSILFKLAKNIFKIGRQRVIIKNIIRHEVGIFKHFKGSIQRKQIDVISPIKEMFNINHIASIKV